MRQQLRPPLRERPTFSPPYGRRYAPVIVLDQRPRGAMDALAKFMLGALALGFLAGLALLVVVVLGLAAGG